MIKFSILYIILFMQKKKTSREFLMDPPRINSPIISFNYVC